VRHLGLGLALVTGITFLIVGWGRTLTFEPAVAVVYGAVDVISLGVAGWGAWALLRTEHHEDWRALARYGPPREVAAAVEAELEAGDQVVSVGQPIKALRLATKRCQEVNGRQALITPSWLVYLWGADDDRATVFRLQDLIVVHRGETTISNLLGFGVSGSVGIFIDRYKVRLRVAGTDEGVGRLVANVLTRVPWARRRFDLRTQQAWEENPEQVIADVNRIRRAQGH
jgi:hypothetical protein